MKLLGGRARLTGISFYTDTNITAATIDDDGNISIKQTSVKAHRLPDKLRKIPFVRGIIALLSIMLDNKLILLLFVGCLVPWDSLISSSESQSNFPNWGIPEPVFYLCLVIFIVTIRFGFTEIWRLHGAEHKAVNAFNRNKELTLDGVKKESRVAINCGTNLIIFIYFVTAILAWPLANHEVLLFLCSISIGYELFKLNPQKPILRPFYVLGGFIQKHIVTSEPKDEEIELAILALKRAIGLDDLQSNLEPRLMNNELQ